MAARRVSTFGLELDRASRFVSPPLRITKSRRYEKAVRLLHFAVFRYLHRYALGSVILNLIRFTATAFQPAQGHTNDPPPKPHAQHIRHVTRLPLRVCP